MKNLLSIFGRGSNNNIVDESSVSISGIQTNALNFKVAGVTFNNDDGESRQKIISKMKSGDILTFKIITFENNPAIAIFNSKNKQIGFVKKGNVNRTMTHITNGGTAIVSKVNKSEGTGYYYLLYKLID